MIVSILNQPLFHYRATKTMSDTQEIEVETETEPEIVKNATFHDLPWELHDLIFAFVQDSQTYLDLLEFPYFHYHVKDFIIFYYEPRSMNTEIPPGSLMERFPQCHRIIGHEGIRTDTEDPRMRRMLFNKTIIVENVKDTENFMIDLRLFMAIQYDSDVDMRDQKVRIIFHRVNPEEQSEEEQRVERNYEDLFAENEGGEEILRIETIPNITHWAEDVFDDEFPGLREYEGQVDIEDEISHWSDPLDGWDGENYSVLNLDFEDDGYEDDDYEDDDEDDRLSDLVESDDDEDAEEEEEEDSDYDNDDNDNDNFMAYF